MCENLTSIDFRSSSSVDFIGVGAFAGCIGLISITIPKSVTEICGDAFGCNLSSGHLKSKLATVTFESGSQLTYIGSGAFYGCAITEVTIPASVKTIEASAFQYCLNLATVKINAPSLNSYGSQAFSNNADGRKIYVPSSKTYKDKWPDYQNDIVTDLSMLTGDYTAYDGEVLTGSTGYKVSISSGATGATVTLSNVYISNASNPAITCNGTATIVLADGTTNTLESAVYQAIEPGGGVSTLTITGTGTLNATGNDLSPAIGDNCGNIIIDGGKITATGGSNAPGIGSKYKVDCGDITINGGTITATGGYGSPGIGSAYGDDQRSGSCGKITINGGTVNATGGSYASGIGSGYSYGSIVTYD